MRVEFVTSSEEETSKLGISIGKKLTPNSVIALFGELGAGKTTLVKSIASVIGGIQSSEVNSPTFNFLNTYEGLLPLYHFDLYRLKDKEQFVRMGFDEYFFAGGVCCIEWAERIRSILPKKYLGIFIEHEEGSRRITIESKYEEINF